MSNNYDNWERLVEAVLHREQFRKLARESSSSSMSSVFISQPGSPLHDDHMLQHESDYADVRTILFGGKMAVLGSKEKRKKKRVRNGFWVKPAILNDIINRLLLSRHATIGPKVPDVNQILQPQHATIGRQVTNGQEIEPAILDDIINRLLHSQHSTMGLEVCLLENEICALCNASRKIFLSQSNLLDLQTPIKICGNIYGQYVDLLRLFEIGGLPPKANYLFLGGYVDYGKQSLETTCLLLAFKIKYPENFFLLRGNHEVASINRIYGFYDECKRHFNVRLWKVFNDCFNCLPVAALIGAKILCAHAGCYPGGISLDQIRNLPRPTCVPYEGLGYDFVLPDPDEDAKGWGMKNGGVSYTFGIKKVTEFLDNNDLDIICRSHQVVKDGYELFAGRRVVTIFSAPNYRGEYENAGAIMSVDESLVCVVQILKPSTKRRGC